MAKRKNNIRQLHDHELELERALTDLLDRCEFHVHEGHCQVDATPTRSEGFALALHFQLLCWSAPTR
jgi:hypothetical protein